MCSSKYGIISRYFSNSSARVSGQNRETEARISDCLKEKLHPIERAKLAKQGQINIGIFLGKKAFMEWVLTHMLCDTIANDRI
jgi:hypothetical protein